MRGALSSDHAGHALLESENYQLALLNLYEATTQTPSVSLRLAACRRELGALIPVLVEHLRDEEDAIQLLSLLGGTVDDLAAERVVSEGIARLRELRAVLSAMTSLIERTDDEVAGDAEALFGFLRSTIEDFLIHETSVCPLRRGALLIAGSADAA